MHAMDHVKSFKGNDEEIDEEFFVIDEDAGRLTYACASHAITVGDRDLETRAEQLQVEAARHDVGDEQVEPESTRARTVSPMMRTWSCMVSAVERPVMALMEMRGSLPRRQ